MRAVYRLNRKPQTYIWNFILLVEAGNARRMLPQQNPRNYLGQWPSRRHQSWILKLRYRTQARGCVSLHTWPRTRNNAMVCVHSRHVTQCAFLAPLKRHFLTPKAPFQSCSLRSVVDSICHLSIKLITTALFSHTQRRSTNVLSHSMKYSRANRRVSVPTFRRPTLHEKTSLNFVATKDSRHFTAFLTHYTFRHNFALFI
jgi:hypothetical protein